jgi:hypothetical protein
VLVVERDERQVAPQAVSSSSRCAANTSCCLPACSIVWSRLA